MLTTTLIPPYISKPTKIMMHKITRGIVDDCVAFVDQGNIINMFRFSPTYCAYLSMKLDFRDWHLKGGPLCGRFHKAPTQVDGHKVIW